MLPDSPSPRAALALSDLQPQTGASTFAVGTGSGNCFEGEFIRFSWIKHLFSSVSDNSSLGCLDA
ncbi:unnamed protein product [Cylicostephanus goldi]|uniref:Uncharacterized protein n=1 Tax=Cylicostephanus goldi TaxID=71465 RepID=A0A3P6QUD0_CYLGO|nr:unnamed protein product [Cylicostephanus goldi]